LSKMRVDIFPPLNLPRIYVYLQYGGMSPSQMEGLIVNQFELMFQYVDGVSQVESHSIQQVAMVKLSFFPGTDMGLAMAQVSACAARAMSQMPIGTLPPLVIRMDEGSVPVGYLVLESESTPLGKVGDLANNYIRPLVQKNVPGTIGTPPFGPNVRSILVNVDPDKLRNYNLNPQDVVQALMRGNVVIPAGNLYMRDLMPLVPTNALVKNIQEMGEIPLKLGANVYIRDVATISDSTDVNYGYALVNGRKSVYLPILKKDTASTLDVVANIHAAMPAFRDVLPKDVRINFEFDESPTVVTAIKSVGTEGIIGAALTGLMIMLFLGDWRSVIVVVSNIPLALMGSLFGLYITGNSINIMSLGGLALAIGILVDEATVEVENIHAQFHGGATLARAVRRGNSITAVARLLALACILSVFIPAFIMEDPLRALFMPLALGVGFAMISSYLLSSTFVPVMAVWLLKLNPEHVGKKGLFDKVEAAYERFVGGVVALRYLVVPAYLGVVTLILVVAGSRLGTELFPQIDSGQFVLRFRPPPGTNFEVTRQMGQKALEIIEREAGKDQIDISIGFAGQIAPYFGLNNMILLMRGPDDGMLRVAFREGSGIELDEFREKMRKKLPEEIAPWLAGVMVSRGVPKAEADVRSKEISFGFEPGDMVSNVMSFGSPTPLEIVVYGPNLADVREHATRIRDNMAKIGCLRDVQFHQTLDYPSVDVTINREKAGLSGVDVQNIGDSVLVATNSSRYVALNYWQDQKTGFDYQVEVLVPTQRMTSTLDVENLPLRMVNPVLNLMVRDVADVKAGVIPGQIDRTSSQRYISISANLEGADLGTASRLVEKAVADAGQSPKGVRLMTRGQTGTMNDMFRSLGIGLGIAVAVILVLLTAYFQAPRLALTSIAAVPGVISGVVLALVLTHTTLNIESFMGSIMCIGVSVSNSVMMVTFMNDRWLEGMAVREAAVKGAAGRLRPIIMTACAMTIGMLPMALALEEGSQMQAPLGRAVIGGLVFSTFSTLLVLPAVFSLILGNRKPVSVSIDPDDPDGLTFDGGDKLSGQAGHREGGQ
ncbi:MAG: efflux RND transporter permease subunit, partial [Gemmataceae bacterium]|nr:efflux RND transporter permease subunit [Gemmataceae bacterium]